MTTTQSIALQQGDAVAATSGDVGGLRARAILSQGDRQHYTFHREESPRRAMARGLKEYLEQLSITWRGGRLLKWESTKVEWAEPEEPAHYPALSIVGAGEAEYEASDFHPRLIKLDGENGDGTGRYLKKACEAKQGFQLLIWATDPVERSGLECLVEDALEPADFMTGLRLELPYYFNARATFEKTFLDDVDDAVSAHRRWRRSLVTVVGVVEQLVPVGAMQVIRPRVEVRVA
jgi:hypothetical protein